MTHPVDIPLSDEELDQLRKHDVATDPNESVEDRAWQRDRVLQIFAIRAVREISRRRADEKSASITENLENTRVWISIKYIVSMHILNMPDSDEKTRLVGFLGKHWPSHAPREIEFATLTTRLTKMEKLLDIPEKERR